MNADRAGLAFTHHLWAKKSAKEYVNQLPKLKGLLPNPGNSKGIIKTVYVITSAINAKEKLTKR